MLEAIDQEKKASGKEDEGFVIDNDSKASWALRKIRHMKEKQKENEELAESQIEKIQKEIDEIKEWLDKENGKIQDNIDFLKNKLKSYAMELKEENPDLKTHNLPFGALKFRKRRPKWNYDEDKLLKFAKSSLQEAVKVKKKVDKRKLKKKAKVVGNKAVITESGEIIEGVNIVQRPEKFKIDVDI